MEGSRNLTYNKNYKIPMNHLNILMYNAIRNHKILIKDIKEYQSKCSWDVETQHY